MHRENKIDILLPTYNGEKFLREQIDSILNQSIDIFRLYIRDDGSKDNTLEIIKEYALHDERVIHVESPEGNLGLVKSIDKMLTLSNADLIFFADQDDVWINNKIEKFVSFYNTIKDADELPVLIHSNCYITDEKLNITGDFVKNIAKSNAITDSLFNFFVQGSSSMINKKLKETSGKFPDNVYVHDRYLHMISQLFGQRYYLDTPLMYYRQHDNNVIGAGNIRTKIKNNLKGRKFYLPEEKLLMNSLLQRFPQNKYLLLYEQLTSNSTRLQKIKLLNKNKIKLPLKQYFFLLFKN
ncbi:glycosyltransferase family 2 protein [Empedobacter falsenii]